MDAMHAGSKIVLRFEEVDQTNDFIDLGVKANGFDTSQGTALAFELARVRSLGEFVKVFTSERRKNYGLVKKPEEGF